MDKQTAQDLADQIAQDYGVTTTIEPVTNSHELEWFVKVVGKITVPVFSAEQWERRKRDVVK